MLSGSEVRTRFLEFFRARNHTVMPSASLVPENDPTLLWIVAGMQPFKKYFLGKEVPPSPRLSDCQKCLRTNDIDNVGRTARHHTFFEMLGNFSFGDYFKAAIVPWAWEFVTDQLELSPEAIWVTIHPDDEEAYHLWTEVVGLPPERVKRLADNFWGFGVGPCGPCSEIFVDRGESWGCGSPECGVECECGRFLEIWNLVFIQFNRDANDVLTPLERPCIDTGMGLERVASVVQNVATNFDTDLFLPIVEFTASRLGATYGTDARTDMALKVIADHARAVVFTVADGVMPSNEGRGYVIRRILRRSLRYGKLMGQDRPFLFEVCDHVIGHFAAAYPSLLKSRDQILKVVRAEEERFQSTLALGLALLDTLTSAVVSRGETVLPGADVFRLYDTYGFPLEVTEEIAQERGLVVDKAGFDMSLAAQRDRARSARAEASYTDSEMAAYAFLRGKQTEFHGYETLTVSATVTALVVGGDPAEAVEAGQLVDVVLDSTPFYAESGGQVGDVGTISGGNGASLRVEATKRPFEGVVVHRAMVVRGALRVGDTVIAEVDSDVRLATARNHSSTHLLHRALREVLGEHVHQAGSLVGPERLRFDFSHFSALTSAELAEVEMRVNQNVMAGLAISTEVRTLEEARALGATALFGEKYGATVRVVRMGDYSMELCGGTHLANTGQAGLFRLLSEGGIAAGVRRIEATTGFGALGAVRESERLLRDAADSLKVTPEELPSRVDKLVGDLKGLERDLAAAKAELARKDGAALLAKATRTPGGQSVLIEPVAPMAADELRAFGDYLRDSLEHSVIVLASVADDGKVALLAMVSKELIPKVQAGALVKEAARICEGGGGGRPDMAQAGGRNASKVPEAIAAIRAIVDAALA